MPVWIAGLPKGYMPALEPVFSDRSQSNPCGQPIGPHGDGAGRRSGGFGPWCKAFGRPGAAAPGRGSLRADSDPVTGVLLVKDPQIGVDTQKADMLEKDSDRAVLCAGRSLAGSRSGAAPGGGKGGERRRDDPAKAFATGHVSLQRRADHRAFRDPGPVDPKGRRESKGPPDPREDQS